MECSVNQESLVCRHCGRKAARANVRRICINPPNWFGMAGLGDFVQYWLMVCGITEETRAVKWLLSRDGEGCGCKTRQEKLNAAVPFDWGLLRDKAKAAAWSLWKRPDTTEATPPATPS